MPSNSYRVKLIPLLGHEQSCPRLHFVRPVPDLGDVISASVNVKAVVTGVQLEPATPFNMAPDRRVYEVSAVEVPCDSEPEDAGGQVQLIIAAAEQRTPRQATNWGTLIVEGLREAGYDIRRRTAAPTPAKAPADDERQARSPVLVWP